jgi:phosphate uptake regulator
LTLNTERIEEKRKLQLTGGSTYIVSLPKSWIIQNKLKKGISLYIRKEEDGSLLILPPEFKKSERGEDAYIDVTPKEIPDAIIRKTVAAYLIGYNMIHLKPLNQPRLSSKQRNAIKTFSRNMLIGTEIVTDTSTDLTLQVLLSYPELSLPSALRRMCIITASMHRDAITALKNLDYQLAKGVIETDNEVNRFHLYIIRQLKTAVRDQRIIKEMGLTNPRDCLGYRLITKSVERTADHATNIAKKTLLLKNQIHKDILEKIEELSEIAVSSFEMAVEALFKRDFQIAENVIERIEKTMKNASFENGLVLSKTEEDMIKMANIQLITESIRRTGEYASDIAEIVLNLTIESLIDKM